MISSGLLIKLCQRVDSYWGIDSHIYSILRDQPLKITGLHWVKVLVAECLVIQTSTGDIFVFKSSDSREDWDDNYKFFPIKVHMDSPSCCFVCGTSTIHTGFNKQFMFLKDELEKLKTNTSAIYTGFSLGGALATLSSYHLDYKSRELVTFGCPKVGNKEFVSELQKLVKRNERWVYKKDYVTRLPPGKYYQHTGSLNVLGYSTLRHTISDGPFYYCNKKHQDDHDINKYIAEMEKFV
jgi:hypothetical protein